MGKGEEEGKIWVRGGHQQEAEHIASPTASSTPKRVLPKEARGGHLQDKHGKEAQRDASRKQEQSGEYIFNVKLNFKRMKHLTSCFGEI